MATNCTYKQTRAKLRIAKSYRLLTLRTPRTPLGVSADLHTLFYCAQILCESGARLIADLRAIWELFGVLRTI